MKCVLVCVVAVASCVTASVSLSSQSSAGDKQPAEKNNRSDREAVGALLSVLIEKALEEGLQEFCEELGARTSMERALVMQVLDRDSGPDEKGLILTISLIQAAGAEVPASTRSARFNASCLVVFTKCSTASVAKTTAVVSYAEFGKGQVNGVLEKFAYDAKGGWQGIKSPKTRTATRQCTDPAPACRKSLD
jgi:hypothetical protein